MLKAIATLALFSAAFAACAAAQVPPRYEIVTIDDDPTFNYAAQMNNRGQVVYTVWFDEGNTDATDIFLYDNGNTIRLTDDDVFDRTPDINDDGTIVWSRAVDGPGSPTQIVMQQYPDLPLDKRAILITVNQEVASLDRRLQANDTVSFLPFISGG